MGRVIVGMTMSLDGYINDRSGSVDKLYSDFSELKDAPAFKEMIKNTGAVIAKRENHEF